MATRMLRRGLPRVPGGEPWPPADAVAEAVTSPVVERADASSPVAERADYSSPVVERADASPVAERVDYSSPVVERAKRDETSHAALDESVPVGSHPHSTTLRRGLPRTPGGEPWPPAETAPTAGAAAPTAVQREAPMATDGATLVSAPATSGDDTPDVGWNRESVPRSGVSATDVESAEGTWLRRGLPRTVGGDPWPPAGVVARISTPAVEDQGDDGLVSAASAAGTAVTATAANSSATAVLPPASAAILPAAESGPIPFRRTVWDGRAPRHIIEAPASARPRPTWPQAVAALFAAAGLGVLAAAAVALVRTLLSLEALQDFLAAFPGHYEPTVAVAPGFAPWIGWQHFFNMFLMVLIIRSGLTIRREKRPTAFWTPKNNPKGKVSLTIWFHQALDILWLTNGVIFLVLLFVTGHWVRVVPTSWEVLPNALSAGLQYVSFDWPTENGWNNYNSLQQLAYFVTVFLAAPLAAVTGFRMSGLWPKKAEKLSKAYPIEWARKVHFPVMIYFVLFIIAHVALVFLTGFLANLNHMFASSDAVSWTGFWVFVAALAVIAAGWAAARPLVIAPIAKVFGTVSGR